MNACKNKRLLNPVALPSFLSRIFKFVYSSCQATNQRSVFMISMRLLFYFIYPYKCDLKSPMSSTCDFVATRVQKHTSNFLLAT